MTAPAKNRYRILIVSILLCLIFSLCLDTKSYGLMFIASNIKEIAIYGGSSNYGKSLYPGSLVFNVTSSTTISNIVSSIEFSTERDCSAMGAICNARVYIKYNDNTIEIYDLFGSNSHISKLGIQGSCYHISASGQSLFESNTQ